MYMKVSEVFRDTSYPEVTYVERREGDKEKDLADYLFKESIAVSISGPSKSGKSALLKHVIRNWDITPDYFVEVRGNNIKSEKNFWQLVLKQLDEPTTRQYKSRKGTKSTDKFTIGAAIQALTAKYSKSETNEDFEVIIEDHDLGLNTILDIYEKEEFVIFIDDAHKISEEIHQPIAEQIKEGVDKELKFCTGYIDYRSDALTSADIDLSSRVESVQLDSWEKQELIKIADKGFGKLNLHVDDSVISILAQESIQSPQLMQKLCYELCTENGFYYGQEEKGKITISKNEIKGLLRSVGESLRETYSTEFDLITGAAKGNTEKQYNWIDGESGDRYATVLRGIAANPPKVSFKLNKLKERIYNQCSGDAPQSGNITIDIKRMNRWTLLCRGLLVSSQQ